MMQKTLVIADHLNNTLNEATAQAITCARELGGATIDVLVLARDGAAVATSAAELSGVSQVLQVDHPANAHPMAAVLAPQIVEIVQQGDYSHVLGPNTTFGKDLMPCVAALLGVGMITDIMSVQGPYEFERPIYAGNAVTRVRAPQDQILVGSVRCASYTAAPAGDSAEIRSVTTTAALPEHTRFVEMQEDETSRPDLQTARRVIGGGRGIGSEANFALVYSLADDLNAAVGASRAAVDAGYVPNDMQVGQTGKIIAPDLYICFGISGAIQHQAGIKDAGTIVAINQDDDAPIFDIADIGMIGDLFEIIPELRKALT